MKKADVLILGAGCAGTSLAHYLEDFGYAGKVVLLDLRTKFDREQRWCGWGRLPASLETLVQKTWRSWAVGDENGTTVRSSENFAYQQIYAPQFFEHFHSRWKSSKSSLELNLGEKVVRVENKKDFVEVETDREMWQARYVFDARHQGSANLKNAEKTRGIYLHQTFLGCVVKFPRPVFDERNATLMDFRTAQHDGVNFIYVLPYSESGALIESTSFSQNPTVWINHLNAVTKYTAENFGDDYEIISEESGELPMTTADLPVKTDERIYNIGVAGGGARPSSGYAFQRIQRQTSAIARAIVGGNEIPQTVAPRKYRFFDAVFLEAIARKPVSAKDFFLRMFTDIEPDALIRFLNDESSLADDLAVISALPKTLFGKAGLQSLWRKIAAGREKDEEIRASHDALRHTLDKSVRGLAARRIGR